MSVMLNLNSDWALRASNKNQASDHTLVNYDYSVTFNIYIFQLIDHLNVLFQLIIHCCRLYLCFLIIPKGRIMRKIQTEGGCQCIH